MLKVGSAAVGSITDRGVMLPLLVRQHELGSKRGTRKAASSWVTAWFKAAEVASTARLRFTCYPLPITSAAGGAAAAASALLLRSCRLSQACS